MPGWVGLCWAGWARGGPLGVAGGGRPAATRACPPASPQVRLGTYSAKAAHVPPAALVATRAMAADPRAEPRFGERVPYVVVYGEPG